MFLDPACQTYSANGWDTPVVRTDTGTLLVTCLDPFDMEAQKRQRLVGTSLAATGTGTALIVAAVTLCSVHYVRRAFREMELLVHKPGSGRAGVLVREAQAREAQAANEGL